MVAKKYQNPSGGLNEAGRKFFKRTTGANLKRPSKKVGNKRRASFCARMKGKKVVGNRKNLDMAKDGNLTKKDFAMLRNKKKKKA